MPELAGVTVVVTRPEHQADELCRSIEQLGGSAVRFPVIEIRPPADVDRLKTTLQNLDQYPLAIFVSANAVSPALKIINAQKGWPQGVTIAAVGRATEKALIDNGLKVRHLAPEPFNSEALLSLPGLQSMSGQRVMIFRGNGGRELLANTLRERGADVEYVECYQRAMPKTDVRRLYALWNRDDRVAIVVTSNEGLKNLQTLVDNEHQNALLSTSLIVVSERVSAAAKKSGFVQEPLVAESASNDAILNAIKQWASA